MDKLLSIYTVRLHYACRVKGDHIKCIKIYVDLHISNIVEHSSDISQIINYINMSVFNVMNKKKLRR